MRKLTALLVAVGMVFGASGMAMAAGTDATDTASIGATVLAPIAITKTADLNFGSFAIDATDAGTVVIAPAGGRSVTGGAALLTGKLGTVTAAAFNVTGEASATYSITLPTTVTITHTDLSTTMSVGTFISNPTDGAGGVLSVGGAQTVTVGATLTVPNGKLAGVYANTTGLPVTVAYN